MAHSVLDTSFKVVNWVHSDKMWTNTTIFIVKCVLGTYFTWFIRFLSPTCILYTVYSSVVSMSWNNKAQQYKYAHKINYAQFYSKMADLCQLTIDNIRYCKYHLVLRKFEFSDSWNYEQLISRRSSSFCWLLWVSQLWLYWWWSID